MKILIIGFSKIKYMPYMNFYLENIDKTVNDVSLIYWNRDLNEENTSFLSKVTLHEFRCRQDDDVSKILKIGSFLKFRRYAKSVIDNEDFDFIIILHSLPGVLLCDTLRKEYRDKYIFDYRDSTYERFAPFKKIIGRLVENSVATFVSSDGFRRFLPARCSSKIYTSHNLLQDSLSHRDEKVKNGIVSDKIRIAFWGFIRNEELNKEIIRKLCNDERFELHYYGREQQVALNLKALVSELSATNIYFHGEYTPEQRYQFVRQTDIIHNIFNDNNMMLAMGNKYYDGLIFRIPQICMPNSFMGECVERAGVGFLIDPASDTFADDIYSEYVNLTVPKLSNNCNAELERVLREYHDGITVINKLVNRQQRKTGR